MTVDKNAHVLTEFDMHSHCHVNTNAEGDRFVGIKVDTGSDDAMVYFPIGYDLPEDDRQLRRDIRHLIQVLSEFTTRDDRLLAANRFAPSQSVVFPIHAYQSVIEYYFSIGGAYYVETEQTYTTGTRGKKDWARTARKQMPLIQHSNGVSSFVYTRYEIRATIPNDTKLITQINRFCVYEAFRRLGWLYVSYMPEEPGPHPDIKTSISILQAKLAATFDDRKKSLFKGMKDMLEYMDTNTGDKDFFYGTEDFAYVWEKLIDRAFGEKEKERFFPHARWLLDYGRWKEKHPLMPDTIMLCNGRYYILDAKYYKYGCTGIPDHLPDTGSIQKQITYGEYLEKYKEIDAESVFNAFIMPYNMRENPFGLTAFAGNIGEAIGDWRRNRKAYERIQGIVMDTRYLMYLYAGKPAKERVFLAECIEKVLSRPPIEYFREMEY